MPYFRPETFSPSHHGKIAILLLNLGSPEAPTEEAVRQYLKPFLLDRRIVETPRLIWWPILYGTVLRRRPRQSAEKYASIWYDEGAPLKVHTARQAKLLKGYFHNAAMPGIEVAWAMRYGKPSIDATFDELKAKGCERILVFPLYPQYSATTIGSSLDAVAQYLLTSRNLPEIRFVRGFHEDKGYISALAQNVRAHWQKHDPGELLVLSFHGIPARAHSQGDPYHAECLRTAKLLSEELSLPQERWLVTFQSRFGRKKWLQPYTQPTLERLAQQGQRHVDILCPGFVSDCLETLEEIAIGCKEAFLKHGGQRFNYIPCLNERDAWIRTLLDLSRKHMGGW